MLQSFSHSLEDQQHCWLIENLDTIEQYLKLCDRHRQLRNVKLPDLINMGEEEEDGNVERVEFDLKHARVHLIMMIISKGTFEQVKIQLFRIINKKAVSRIIG